MRLCSCLAMLLLWSCALAAAAPPETQPVGPLPEGGHVVPTAQLVRPAGQTIEIAGRPVCVALSPDGNTLYAKSNRGVVVIEAEDWSLRQEIGFEKDGGSMAGIAVSPDGSRVYATTAGGVLAEASVGSDGRLTWARRITLPGPDGKGNAFPCGLAVSQDGGRAVVCLSRNNSLAIVTLPGGEVKEIPVGVAPTAVVLARHDTLAIVTNWGGRRAKAGDRTADSAGTPAVVDERGIAASGTVSLVDLTSGTVTRELEPVLFTDFVSVDPNPFRFAA